MNFSDAIDKIEKKAMEFGFLDKYDQPLLPAEAVARIANMCGEEWTDNQIAVEEKTITFDEYYKRAITMIDRIQALNQNAEIDLILGELSSGEKSSAQL